MSVAAGRFFFRVRNALFPCAIALAFVPAPAIFADPLVAAAVGFALASLGQLVRAATVGLQYIRRGGRLGRIHADVLVTGGMFAHSRNPLYFGNLVMITGLGFASNSWIALVAAPTIFVLAYLCIVAAEEEYLALEFGPAYREYRESTPRFVPRLKGLAGTLRAGRFNWRRLVVKEYGTACAWIGGIILLTIYNLWRDPDQPARRHQIAPLVATAAVVALAYAVTRLLKKTGKLVGD